MKTDEEEFFCTLTLVEGNLAGVKGEYSSIIWPQCPAVHQQQIVYLPPTIVSAEQLNHIAYFKLHDYAMRLLVTFSLFPLP